MQQMDRWPDQHTSLDRSGNLERPAHPSHSRIEAAGEHGRLLEKAASRAALAEEGWRKMLPGSTAPIPAHGDTARSFSGLIHDARNMVSAMDLYCDLLEEPGVLTPLFRHYAGELRLVSGAGRRLLEELAAAESMTGLQEDAPPPSAAGAWPGVSPGSGIASDSRTHAESPAYSRANTNSELRALSSAFLPLASSARAESPAEAGRRISAPDPLIRDGRRRVFLDSARITSLADELCANRNLLSALVGPAVTVGLSLSGGRRPIAMTGDDLTRVLVNLARNAGEAMPHGGHLQIALEEGPEYLSLSFTDSGPGIPETALESIFHPGFSTRAGVSRDSAQPSEVPLSSPVWPVQHRGLGLSIVRSIVTAAGGSIWAVNRRDNSQNAPSPLSGTHGAVFLIEFPLLEASRAAPSESLGKCLPESPGVT